MHRTTELIANQSNKVQLISKLISNFSSSFVRLQLPRLTSAPHAEAKHIYLTLKVFIRYVYGCILLLCGSNKSLTINHYQFRRELSSNLKSIHAWSGTRSAGMTFFSDRIGFSDLWSWQIHCYQKRSWRGQEHQRNVCRYADGLKTFITESFFYPGTQKDDWWSVHYNKTPLRFPKRLAVSELLFLYPQRNTLF